MFQNSVAGNSLNVNTTGYIVVVSGVLVVVMSKLLSNSIIHYYLCSTLLSQELREEYAD